MDMIRDRNLTSHTYNEEIANSIVASILRRYYNQFRVLQQKLAEEAKRLGV